MVVRISTALKVRVEQLLGVRCEEEIHKRIMDCLEKASEFQPSQILIMVWRYIK